MNLFNVELVDLAETTKSYTTPWLKMFHQEFVIFMMENKAFEPLTHLKLNLTASIFV